MRLHIAVHPRIYHVRLGLLPTILTLVMTAGFGAAILRFSSGIGAISNLSNTYPWGFWISFDIYTGIAISSGAFLLAAAVYVFDLKRFRPLLMPSILTALIGYFMEVLALMVDLGRPERIFNMLFYQNYTSHMLVVGLCVMIYLAILSAEFAPVVLKSLGREKWAAATRPFMVPLFIVGVVVSVIHQGSLGSLLLIQPSKLHPLWWTPLLPIMFFVSSISIGLGMIIIESSLSSRYFKRGLELHLLESLAKAIPYSLGSYALLKGLQLILSGNIRYLFGSGVPSLLFWAEMALGVGIPIALFARPANRRSPKCLLGGSAVMLVGMILNRFNVSWLGIQRLADVRYVPSLLELSISAAIFSFGFMAFGLAARHLPVFESPREPEGRA